MQRFRGDIYLHDDAITRQDLSADGLHQTPEDDSGLARAVDEQAAADQRQRPVSGARQHGCRESLRVKSCPLAQQDEWRPKLWKAVKSEIALARSEQLQYVELGGWAVAPEIRRTSGPLTMALGVYGFSRRNGGALGMTTATFRHCSAVILQRLGGSRFEVDGTTLPPYYDARYKCMMEMLRFDSRRPNPKYIDLIDRLRDKLADALVITRPATIGIANPSGIARPYEGVLVSAPSPNHCLPRDGS